MNYLFVFGMIVLAITIIGLLYGWIDYQPPNYECSSKKGEEICRHYLREIFGKPFHRAHPRWLRNPETGKCLELDCYNAELMIALEYNGEQHYVYPNTFHRTREDFDAQLRRDKFKADKCKERGVLLIVVPYNIPKSEIREFIKRELVENKII